MENKGKSMSAVTRAVGEGPGVLLEGDQEGIISIWLGSLLENKYWWITATQQLHHHRLHIQVFVSGKLLGLYVYLRT